MGTDQPHINPYLFQRQFEAFSTFIEDRSGVALVSFTRNPYIENREAYKYEIYRAARDALAFQGWKRSDIRSGKIADAVIRAIEIPTNNLVLSWSSKNRHSVKPPQLISQIHWD